MARAAPSLERWWTIDPSAMENWAPASGAARYTSPLQPQLTDAERTYWKQTGTVPALQAQSPNNFSHFPGNSTQQNTRYVPMDLVGISLGTGVGGRPDIGLQNEYVSEWWSSQTPRTSPGASARRSSRRRWPRIAL